jgi:hypothetical protein
MKQNALKTSFGRVDKKTPDARIIFSLSPNWCRRLRISLQNTSWSSCAWYFRNSFSRFLYQENLTPDANMFFSRSLELYNSLFSMVSCNFLIRSFNSDRINLSIGLSYWCGSKYISLVADCKELLSDSSLKLSGGLGTGKSVPWGTGRTADKRY